MTGPATMSALDNASETGPQRYGLAVAAATGGGAFNLAGPGVS